VSSWMVSNIPSGVLAVGLIAVIAGGAASIQRYVRRRFPALKGDAHNDGTKFTYGLSGSFMRSSSDSLSTPCGVRTTPPTPTHAPKAQQRCKWQETQWCSMYRTETAFGRVC
jgi:hypothetical protein